jgi:hypothetical protein
MNVLYSAQVKVILASLVLPVSVEVAFEEEIV